MCIIKVTSITILQILERDVLAVFSGKMELDKCSAKLLFFSTFQAYHMGFVYMYLYICIV